MAENDNTADNVIRSPYCVASRKVIGKLMDAGYLRRDRRHDAKAVETALNALRKYSAEFWSSLRGKDGEPPPAG
jgi:hypothetical protein